MRRGQFTNEQSEALIAGGAPRLEDQPLGAVLDVLRSLPSGEIDDQEVRRISAASAERARENPAESGPNGRSHRIPTPVKSMSRPAAAMATAVVLFLSTGTGVAFAADGAAPGDLLYGLDRALEAIGLDDGGIEERLQETEELVAEGDVVRGLEHAAQLISAAAADSGSVAADDAARVALLEAAKRVKKTQSGPSDATRDDVATLLHYLSDNVGQVDGHQVAELAKLIERGADKAAQTQGENRQPVDPPGLADSPRP